MDNPTSTSGSKRGKARDDENRCNNDVPWIDVLRSPLLPPNTLPNHGYLISPLARNTKSQPVVYDVSKEEIPLESFKSLEVRYSRGTRQFKSRTNNPCPTKSWKCRWHWIYRFAIGVESLLFRFLQTSLLIQIDIFPSGLNHLWFKSQSFSL